MIVKKLIQTSIFVFLSSQILFCQKTWVNFAPPGENFEIEVPHEMKDGQKKILTEVGELKPTTWICQGQKGDQNHLYLVSYVDYPTDTFHPDSTALIRDFLQASLETHINDLHGTLTYQSESPYITHPGILYRASYNDNKHVVKSRVILIGDRFYAIQVYTNSEKSLNEDMNKFLYSFRLKS
jgi:hypothetical protein